MYVKYVERFMLYVITNVKDDLSMEKKGILKFGRGILENVIGKIY